MPLVWVTGISGTGKSTVRAELRARGHPAYGTDEDGLACWQNRLTGGLVHDVSAEMRTPEWLAAHDWNADRPSVAALGARHPGETVFVCGVVANEHEIRDLFTTRIALCVDEMTLLRRLAERTGNDYGKSDHELREILEWQRDARERYHADGCILVNAHRPVATVADDVVRIAARSVGATARELA